MPTLSETVDLLMTLRDAVYQIEPWRDRHYVNLRHVDRSFAGDRNDKFYLDDRAVLVYQQGKGTNSAAFKVDRETLLDFCATRGIAVERK